jgi:hypothetical protein
MKHEVDFTIPWCNLGKADVVFQIRGEEGKIGELRVSRGSLVWYPKNNKYGRKIVWSQFDDVMSNYPQVEKKS